MSGSGRPSHLEVTGARGGQAKAARVVPRHRDDGRDGYSRRSLCLVPDIQRHRRPGVVGVGVLVARPTGLAQVCPAQETEARIRANLSSRCGSNSPCSSATGPRPRLCPIDPECPAPQQRNHQGLEAHSG
jgi:hypothetical protein